MGCCHSVAADTRLPSNTRRRQVHPAPPALDTPGAQPPGNGRARHGHLPGVATSDSDERSESGSCEEMATVRSTVDANIGSPHHVVSASGVDEIREKYEPSESLLAQEDRSFPPRVRDQGLGDDDELAVLPEATRDTISNLMQQIEPEEADETLAEVAQQFAAWLDSGGFGTMIRPEHLEVYEVRATNLQGELTKAIAQNSSLQGQLAERGQRIVSARRRLDAYSSITAHQARCTALRFKIEVAVGVSRDVRRYINKLYIPASYTDARGRRPNFRHLKQSVHNVYTICAEMMHYEKGRDYSGANLTSQEMDDLAAVEHLLQTYSGTNLTR